MTIFSTAPHRNICRRKIRSAKMMISIFDRIENIVEKGGLCDRVNSLPNHKILDWSILKAFCSRQTKCESKIDICFGKGRKHCGKRTKCWLPVYPRKHLFWEGMKKIKCCFSHHDFNPFKDEYRFFNHNLFVI